MLPIRKFFIINRFCISTSEYVFLSNLTLFDVIVSIKTKRLNCLHQLRKDTLYTKAKKIQIDCKYLKENHCFSKGDFSNTYDTRTLFFLPTVTEYLN